MRLQTAATELEEHRHRCVARSSTPLRGQTLFPGGFDSHAFPPFPSRQFQCILLPSELAVWGQIEAAILNAA